MTALIRLLVMNGATRAPTKRQEPPSMQHAVRDKMRLGPPSDRLIILSAWLGRKSPVDDLEAQRWHQRNEGSGNNRTAL